MCKTAVKAAILAGLAAVSLTPARAQNEAGAPVGSVEIYVDGAAVETWDMACVSDEDIFVPLRPVAEALGAGEVTYDREDYSASVRAEGLDIYVPFDEQYFEANGRYFFTEKPIVVVDERCVLPLEPLMAAFGGEYTYDAPSHRVDITISGEPIEPGNRFYDEDDVYWLSRIIEAESGGEPFTGKIAVGNVVMNRVADEAFPSTVEEVIFDRRFGVQFTPAYSGSIYNTPSEASVIAAKLALEGEMIVENGLYFTPVRAAKTCWASRHYDVVAQIGGHVFFG